MNYAVTRRIVACWCVSASVFLLGVTAEAQQREGGKMTYESFCSVPAIFGTQSMTVAKGAERLGAMCESTNQEDLDDLDLHLWDFFKGLKEYCSQFDRSEVIDEPAMGVHCVVTTRFYPVLWDGPSGPDGLPPDGVPDCSKLKKYVTDVLDSGSMKGNKVTLKFKPDANVCHPIVTYICYAHPALE